MLPASLGNKLGLHENFSLTNLQLGVTTHSAVDLLAIDHHLSEPSKDLLRSTYQTKIFFCTYIKYDTEGHSGVQWLLLR